MNISATAALACALMSLATPALATSIANQDSKEHTVRVDRGANEDEQKIAAGATVQVDCPGGCGFTVDGSGYGREPANADKLVITKDGMLDFAERAR